MNSVILAITYGIIDIRLTISKNFFHLYFWILSVVNLNFHFQSFLMALKSEWVLLRGLWGSRAASVSWAHFLYQNLYFFYEIFLVRSSMTSHLRKLYSVYDASSLISKMAPPIIPFCLSSAFASFALWYEISSNSKVISSTLVSLECSMQFMRSFIYLASCEHTFGSYSTIPWDSTQNFSELSLFSLSWTYLVLW